MFIHFKLRLTVALTQIWSYHDSETNANERSKEREMKTMTVTTKNKQNCKRVEALILLFVLSLTFNLPGLGGPTRNVI